MSKNRALQKYLETSSKKHKTGAINCSLMKEVCDFTRTGSNAVVLYDTLRAEFIEKAVCTKTKEQLHQRESERQDLPCQEARSPWETQSETQSIRETGCNIVDYRVPGISLSTVQQQDEQRQGTVAKLIEKFESHKYKEQFLQDMGQTQKINRFSEALQK